MLHGKVKRPFVGLALSDVLVRVPGSSVAQHCVVVDDVEGTGKFEIFDTLEKRL
jgi:hypothetical protein